LIGAERENVSELKSQSDKTTEEETGSKEEKKVQMMTSHAVKNARQRLSLASSTLSSMLQSLFEQFSSLFNGFSSLF